MPQRLLLVIPLLFACHFGFAADSPWVQHAFQQLQASPTDDDWCVNACLYNQAMLAHDNVRALEFFETAYVKCETVGDKNAMAVLLIQKSIALSQSEQFSAGDESYAKATKLFDGECCADLKTLYYLAHARRDFFAFRKLPGKHLTSRAQESARKAADPMVRAIALHDFFTYRSDQIGEKDLNTVTKRLEEVGIPSFIWKCQLKQIRSQMAAGNSEATIQADKYIPAVRSITDQAIETESRDAASTGLRLLMRLYRSAGETEKCLESAITLTELGRTKHSNFEIAMGLLGQSRGNMNLRRIDEAKTTIEEGLALADNEVREAVKRIAYATKAHLSVIEGNRPEVRKYIQKLATLPILPSEKARSDSKNLRAEIDRLLEDRVEVDAAVQEAIQIERENTLRNTSKSAVAFALGFLGVIAFVLARNHRNMSRVNHQLLSVNEKLRKEMEAGERNLLIREKLEQRVAQVQRMDSLGSLAGGIAHDFNNLLVGVVCNAQLLGRPELNDEARSRCIEGILTSAGAATDLSRKMLAYAGREPSEKTKVDVVCLLKHLQPIFDAGDKLAIKYEFEVEEAFAMVDRTHVEQILLNLITNARDATSAAERKGRQPSAPVLVRVGLETIEDVALDKSLIGKRNEGDEFVFVEVQDQGVGMDADQMSRIFEPFFTNKQSGRGMGLAVVYGLINRQDGLIRCSSELGAGTTMRVLLPRTDSKVELQKKPHVVPTLASKGQLVVVDDEHSIRDVVANSFEPRNWAAHRYSSGKVAIPFIEENQASIDCILLDVVMPEMSGRLIVEELDKLGIKIPIVIMSGFSNTNLSEFLKMPNVVSTMSKPFSVSDLLENVSRATFLREDSVARK